MPREITTHKVNGLNEAIKIEAIDEPGPGGANHEYAIYLEDPKEPHGHGAAFAINFQNGPIGEVGVNGISIEALLAIAADRLECFQAGPFACDDNHCALEHVNVAMEILQSRTRDRIARGVEGKLQV